MKCGICKSDSPTYEYRWGNVTEPLPVRDASDLVTHKRQQHPTEYAASLKARKDTKAAHERADRDYQQRRGAAGLAVGRTVVNKRPYGDSPPEVTTTSGISSYDRLSDYRYPEPNAFGLYLARLAEAEQLQNAAAIALRQAFDLGLPVPPADVDQVRAAMDAVQPEGGAS